MKGYFHPLKNGILVKNQLLINMVAVTLVLRRAEPEVTVLHALGTKLHV